MLCTLALVGIGIVTIYGIGHPYGMDPVKPNESAGIYQDQAKFAVIGIVSFCLVNLVHYRWWGQMSYWLFGGTLILLVIILLGKVVHLPFVPSINGSYRWIVIKIAGRRLPSIQPSEFCKVAYILALAWYLRFRSNYESMRALIGPFVLTLVPMVLILAEPDLGTVMLLMPILFCMLFFAGAQGKHLLLIIAMALLVSPILWFKMDGYQRKRVTGVLLQSQRIQAALVEEGWVADVLAGGPVTERWIKDTTLQQSLAKDAISTGGLWGYGFRRGPFLKYNFVQESHNDCIIAMIAHQWGVLGILVVLGLYILLVMCGLEIAVHHPDSFARLLCMGVAAMFTVQVFVNVGMNLGIMPITGLTLPLVSYGGSSLMVNMIALGLLNNVGRSRPFMITKDL